MADMGTDRPPHEGGTSSGSSAGEAFAQLGEGLSDALRDELERLRADLSTRASAAARATGLLAGAGATGAVAAGAAATLPIMFLRKFLPGWMVALLLAGGAGAGSVMLARRGLEELSQAAPGEAERVKDAVRSSVGGPAPAPPGTP